MFEILRGSDPSHLAVWFSERIQTQNDVGGHGSPELVLYLLGHLTGCVSCSGRCLLTFTLNYKGYSMCCVSVNPILQEDFQKCIFFFMFKKHKTLPRKIFYTHNHNFIWMKLNNFKTCCMVTSRKKGHCVSYFCS